MDEQEFQRVKYERFKQKQDNKINYHHSIDQKVKLQMALMYEVMGQMKAADYEKNKFQLLMFR